MNKIKLGDVMGHYFISQRVRENLPEKETFKLNLNHKQTSLSQIWEVACSWQKEEPSITVLRQK